MSYTNDRQDTTPERTVEHRDREVHAGLVVKAKRLHPDAKLPTYAHPGDSGADVRAVEDALVPPRGIAVVPCGFAVEVPEGAELQVRSRSGLASRGLIVANSPGTIDSGYRGEVKVILANLTEEEFHVHRGDRIAQLVLAPVCQASFVEGELTASARGEGGIGSTGVG